MPTPTFKSGLRKSNFRPAFFSTHPSPTSTSCPHTKRKDSYEHTFSNSKGGRHGNHYQPSGSNPPRTSDRAPLPFTPKSRFEVFTTLNTTYENVLMHEAPMIPKHPSKRLSNKPMPNTSVFCHFHQFSGHDTKSCVALRNIIEGLIHEEKLDKYVHNLPPSPNPHQRQINMISTISGGPTLAGTSNNSIKHYVRSSYAYQVFSTKKGRLPKMPKLGWAPITFCEEEECGVIHPHDDPLIIRADISNFDVGRILVDTSSLPIGNIHLPISIGSAPQWARVTTPFLIVDCPTAYNIILGHLALAQMEVFISAHILLLKFPTPMARARCVATNLVPEAAMLQQSNRPIVNIGAEPVEDLELVTLHDDIPNGQVRIRTSLSQELRSDLVAFLRLNFEVFAWSYNDMPDISPDIISYRLNINPAIRPVRQKCRAYDPERYEAIKAEVDKLSSIGFIKEVDYPTWLANVLMVRKPKKGWCIIFAPLIGNTIEVYVDDMLVKSRIADQHISNLSVMFTILKQYKMRRNPTKCAFGVALGKFFGYMISQRGIEANPEKIQAILDMKIPKTVKDIQSLTGRVAALTMFISKVIDRYAPFFKALKGNKRSITWTAECDKAFSKLKEYMSRALLLSTPELGDILTMNLSVSTTAVSLVLISPHEGAEHLVHYVSKGLQDAEPLRQVLQKPETFGSLVKWAIELGEFDLHYKPRPATNIQAVADFISEFTEPHALAVPQIITEPTPPSSQDHVASNGTLDPCEPYMWMAPPMPRDVKLASFSSPQTKLSLSTLSVSNSTPPTMLLSMKRSYLAFG
ncbi:unnamed protein product [Prunus armeniaca]